MLEVKASSVAEWHARGLAGLDVAPVMSDRHSRESNRMEFCNNSGQACSAPDLCTITVIECRIRHELGFGISLYVGAPCHGEKII